MTQALKLENLRGRLIRQEETIIFALIERAQFRLNAPIYEPGAIPLPGYDGSFADYFLHETEKVHARVRRYTSPDEHAFSSDLPAPILPPMDIPSPIHPNTINVNDRIRELYRDDILPLICQPGDCGNYGSSAVCDVACLQALSKRIHYGKYIAEAKFQADEPTYRRLIADRDSDGLLAALRDAAVEARLLQRVERKAATYGQDLDAEHPTPAYKVAPKLVADLYARWIIPLTIDVEIIYLLERLGPSA